MILNPSQTYRRKKQILYDESEKQTNVQLNLF